MGFGGSADIFQAQIMDLMAALEFVRAYMDDLLIITRETLDEHLQKMETVLTRLCRKPIGPTYVVGPWMHEYRKKKWRRFLITEKL